MDDTETKTDTDTDTEGQDQDQAQHQKDDEGSSGAASASVGNATVDLSEEDKEKMLAEREERLDPDNRPDNVEVDNTERDFDIKKGQFADSEDDPEIGPFNDPTAPDGEIEA